MMRTTKLTVLAVCLVIALGVLTSAAMADRTAGPDRTAAGPASEAAVAELVLVDPMTSTVVTNQVFTVGIRVEGALNLAAYEFDLSYDPAVVDVLDVDDGGFMTEESDRVLGGTFQDLSAADTAHFEAFSVPPDEENVPGADGDGRLAVVKLKALTVGVSPLTFGNVLVYDASEDFEEAEGEPPGGTQDGWVVVHPCQDLSILGLDYDTPVAADTVVSFTAVMTGSPPITYTWDFGDESGVEEGVGLNPVTHVYDEGGTYTLALTAANVCPSQDTFTETIEVVAGPDIDVSPTSFVFPLDVDEVLHKVLTVGNTGSGLLTWDLEESSAVDWLEVTPLSGTVPAGDSDALAVVFDAGTLTLGETYSTTLVIGSNDPDEDPVEVPVEVTIGYYPDIAVNPTSLHVLVPFGRSTTRLLTIASEGSLPLDWAMVEDPEVTWLSELPVGGTGLTDGETDPVIVSFDADGFARGTTVTTTLLINSNDPNESPFLVPTSLTVAEYDLYMPVMLRTFIP